METKGEELAGSRSAVDSRLRALLGGAVPKSDGVTGSVDDRGSGEAKAVVEGEIRRLSVSAVATYDTTQRGGCGRKWWLKYVAGLPDRFSKAGAAGKNSHRLIQTYLETGVDELTDVERAALPYMPPPGLSKYAVEHRFDGELTAAGVPFVGYIDLIDAREEIPEVLDWKTTGDLSRALKDDELIHTIQMPGYAQWLFVTEPSLDWVRVSHVYMRTPGKAKKKPQKPKAIKASALWSREVVADRWAEIEDLVTEMKATALATKHEDVEPNFKACDAFGRCAYWVMCHSGGESMGEQLSLLDRLRAGVLPPDAPKSGETGPKADSMTPEEAAALSPEVQALVYAAGSVETPVEKPKRGRPKKTRLEFDEPNAPEWQGVVAKVMDTHSQVLGKLAREDDSVGQIIMTPTRVKEVRLSRKVGLPNYGSTEIQLVADVTTTYEAALEDLAAKVDEFVKAVGGGK